MSPIVQAALDLLTWSRQEETPAKDTGPRGRVERKNGSDLGDALAGEMTAPRAPSG